MSYRLSILGVLTILCCSCQSPPRHHDQHFGVWRQGRSEFYERRLVRDPEPEMSFRITKDPSQLRLYKVVGGKLIDDPYADVRVDPPATVYVVPDLSANLGCFYSVSGDKLNVAALAAHINESCVSGKCRVDVDPLSSTTLTLLGSACPETLKVVIRESGTIVGSGVPVVLERGQPTDVSMEIQWIKTLSIE